MPSKEEHVSKLQALGFKDSMLASFEELWKPLELEGYEMYAMYTGAEKSPLEGQSSCAICSRSAMGLRWEKVITPSQDSAALYLVCSNCDSQYVETALRQKALGRLLKERNTRPT
jgi:formate dehydrogenase maturation protein FdhE